MAKQDLHRGYAAEEQTAITAKPLSEQEARSNVLNQDERYQPQESRQSIRMVDLFSGCGGLSLGFELQDNQFIFDEILAIDNDPAAIRCFNDNFHSDHSFPVGRTTDVNWFSHPSEILLYYLIHFSGLKNDLELSRALESIGVPRFLSHIREIDSSFKKSLKQLATTDGYRNAWKSVHPEVAKLAITKSFAARLSLDALSRLDINRAPLLWEYEYNLLSQTAPPVNAATPTDTQSLLFQDARRIWDYEVAKLQDASERTGKGQHAVNSTRVKSLLVFLGSPQGEKLREIWLRWHSDRNATKASFCLQIDPILRTLYENGREIQLVIGGPPCKGFSRIARPVMHSLREQGASAWTSQEYGDERNALMEQYILFLRTLRPNVFLFENVSNFVSALQTPTGALDPAQALAQGIEALSDHMLQYRVSSQIVQSARHAVPQERDRFIMIGITSKIPEAVRAVEEFFAFPEHEHRVPLSVALQGLGPPHEFNWNTSALAKNPTTSSPSPAYTLLDSSYPASWQQYVAWVRKPKTAEPATTTDAHIYRALRADDAALIELIGPGQRWMDYEIKRSGTLHKLRSILTEIAELSRTQKDLLSLEYSDIAALLAKINSNLALRLLLEDTEAKVGEQHLLLPHYMKNGTSHHGDWLERLAADRPSKTVIAHIGKDTYSYIHPHESRAITMREAARIQSFPDSFKFRRAGIVEGYSMIGNAVPPLLANAFAARIVDLTSKYEIFGPRTNFSEE